MDELEDVVERDICIDCGTGIEKPKPTQITPVILGRFLTFAQPYLLCQRCAEVWLFRKQICCLRPYRLPLWRPKAKVES